MLKHFAEAPVELLHIRAELTGLQLTAHQLHMNLTGGSLCGSSYPNDPSDPKEKLKNMNRERKKNNLPKLPNSCCLKHPNVSFSTGRVTRGHGGWKWNLGFFNCALCFITFESNFPDMQCGFRELFSSTRKYINFQS